MFVKSQAALSQDHHWPNWPSTIKKNHIIAVIQLTEINKYNKLGKLVGHLTFIIAPNMPSLGKKWAPGKTVKYMIENTIYNIEINGNRWMDQGVKK